MSITTPFRPDSITSGLKGYWKLSSNIIDQQTSNGTQATEILSNQAASFRGGGYGLRMSGMNYLKRVSLSLQRNGSPTGTLSVKVYSVDNSSSTVPLPWSLLGTADTTLSAASVSTSKTTYDFDFNTRLRLSDSVIVMLEDGGSGTGDGSNHIKMFGSGGNARDDQWRVVKDNSSVYTSGVNDDHFFIMYDQTTDSLLTDSSGTGNTLTNNATVSGIGDNYFKIDECSGKFVSASSQYLSIADGSQTGLDMSASASDVFTFACWAKHATVGSTQYYAGKGATGYQLLLVSTNAVRLYMNGTEISSPTGLIVAGKWYHLAFVYDRPNNLGYVYVNGNLVATGAIASLSNNASAFNIGADGSGSSTMNGRIKDAAFWTAALTPLQIKSLAHGVNMTSDVCRANSGKFSIPAPSSFWPFNEITAGSSPVSRVDAINSQTAPYFDGSGDYVSVADSTDWNFGTGDFTVEAMFLFTTSLTSGTYLWGRGSGPSLGMRYTSGNLDLYVGGSIPLSNTTTFVVGKWYHIAASRSGTNLRYFIDGVQLGSTVTNSTNITDTATYSLPGASGAGTLFTGYAREWRISNTARYTAGFTPTYTGFTVDSNTKLYLKLNEATRSLTFIDSETTPKTVTTNGNTVAQTVNGFTNNLLIDTNTVTNKDGYFEGAGAYFTKSNSEYLKLVDAAQSNLDIPGNTSFSISVFIKKDQAIGSGMNIVYKYASTTGYYLQKNSSNDLVFNVGNGASAVAVTALSGLGFNAAAVDSVYFHICCVWDSSTKYQYLYIDGQLAAAALNVYGCAPSTGDFFVGSSSTPGDYFGGSIADLALWNGTALTETQVKRLASGMPLQNSANISRWSMDRGLEKIITANGNTTQVGYIYNKAAAWFDGSTGYITVPDSADWDFGTGDFTVEAYAAFKTIGTNQVIVDRNNTSDFTLFRRSTGNLEVQIGGGAIVSSAWTPVLGQWYHLAFSRSGTSVKLFVDGVQLGSTGTNSTNINSADVVGIGRYASSSANYHNGWIKEVRLSNTARYTANFTPSTTQFTSDSNTKLLLHLDSGNTTPLNPAMYFDGTGDYLLLPDSPDWDFGSSASFTFEAFVRFTGTGFQRIFARNDGSDANGFALHYDGSSQIVTYVAGTALAGSFTPTVNRWYHIASVRNSSTVKIYVDGVEKASSTISSAMSYSTPLTIGALLLTGGTSQQYMNGHIKEARVSDVARYTAAFTPTKDGFTVDSNTKLYIKGTGSNGSVSIASTSTETSQTLPISMTSLTTSLGFTFSASPNAQAGQTFTAYRGKLQTGSLGLKRNGSRSSVNCYLEIYETSNGLPTGTALATSDTIGFDTISTSSTLTDFAFSGANKITLTGGKVYAMILRLSTETYDASNYLEQVGVTTSSYSGGNWVRYEGSWVAYTSFDVAFRVYYEGNPTLAVADTKIRYIHDYTAYLVKDSGNTGHLPTIFGTCLIDFMSVTGNASVMVDGSGDYVSLEDMQDWDTGYDDFTIEFWTKHNTQVNGRYFFSHGTNPELGMRIVSGVYAPYYHGGTQGLGPTATFDNFKWYHISMTKVGNNLFIFENGVNIAQATSVVSANGGNNTVFSIGAFNDGSNAHDGWMDGFRFTKGKSRYFDTFDPPQTAFTTDDNTAVLLEFDTTGTTITDTSRSITETRYSRPVFPTGNTFIDTAQAKIGTTSAAFVATNDLIKIRPTTVMKPRTSDFTWEFYFRRSATLGGGKYLIFSSGGGNTGIFSSNVGYTVYFMGSVILSGSWTINQDQWYHVSLSRSGTSLKLFLDGSQVTSATNSTDINNTGNWELGGDAGGGGSLVGWMDEVRVSNSARYTAGFTPTTTAFVTDSNTILLLHMEGTYKTQRFIDSSGNGTGILDDANSRNDASIIESDARMVLGKIGNGLDIKSSTSSYARSRYVDNKFIDIISDLSVMSWFTAGSVGIETYLLTHGSSATGWALKTTTGNKTRILTGPGEQDSTTAFVAGQWIMAGGGYDGTNRYAVINGEIASGSGTGPSYNLQPLTIGASDTPGNYVDGSIDEMLVWFRVLQTEEWKAAYNKAINGFSTLSESIPATTGFGQRGFFMLF